MLTRILTNVEANKRQAEKKLRQLQDEKRRKVEALKARLQSYNLILAPAAVLLIAVVLWIMRIVKARQYAARRTVE